jgi:2-C-methyl-D-erythritol 4-phosphate cytidylyltransferase/2-C-methyl-D-erythritol 2,4-cyclodiphosphate synthase
VAPLREAIREALAGRLGVDLAAVSVKATTTDGMGFLGADEGLAAVAVAVLEG